MNLAAAILCLLIAVVAQASLIWVATKVARLDCTFREALIVAGICGLILLIPKIGFVLAAITFFILAIKWLNADATEALLLSVVTCMLNLMLVWATTR